MLPQVEWATVDNGYPVLVMNPNENICGTTGQKIPHNETMTRHANHVWTNYVKPAGFKRLLILAHSAGGLCLESIMVNNGDSFFENLGKIAVTDSCIIDKKFLTPKQQDFMLQNAIHYQASLHGLGVSIRARAMRSHSTCPHVSAGHSKHEYTTGVSWPMILKQFS